MADYPTVVEIKTAQLFVNTQCAPVVEVLNAFADEIPAVDVYTLVTEMSVETYFTEGDSLEKLAALLEAQKVRLSRIADPQALAQRLDPAIATLRAAKETHGFLLSCATKGNNLNLPMALGPFRPLPSYTLSQQTTDYLRSKIGIDLPSVPEGLDWPGHREMYQRINTKSKILVLVMPDDHSNVPIAADYLRLLLALRQSARYQLAIAMETDASLFEKNRSEAARPNMLIDSLRKKLAAGTDLARLFEQYYTPRENREAVCRAISPRNEAEMSECLETEFVRSAVTGIYFAVFGTVMAYFWPVDGLCKEMLDLKERSQSATTDEERLQGLKGTYEIVRKRDHLMADNLTKRIAGYHGNKPLVVLFRVGAAHVKNLMGILEKQTTASIIGLMSNRYATVLNLQ